MAEGKKSTTIHGFSVELELYMDCGEQRSDCFVSKGRKSCSLTVLQGFGCLDPDAEASESVPVSQHTIDRIERWALANGY